MGFADKRDISNIFFNFIIFDMKYAISRKNICFMNLFSIIDRSKRYIIHTVLPSCIDDLIILNLKKKIQNLLPQQLSKICPIEKKLL